MDKYLSCPICETKVKAEDYIETYISDWNKKEYKLYHCPECELEWWEPLKIEPKFYEEEGEKGYAAFHEGIRTKMGQNHEAFFRYFPKDLKGRLLDIGCGDGVFLKEAQKYGFEVWGIDFDRKSIKTVKRRLGIDTVYPLSLEEFYCFARKRNLQFDLITFFEVLEHQDKPKNFLKMVKNLLKKDGYIAGSVPNRERLFAEITWKFFSGDHPPHHFLRFSKESLENTLKIVGFSEVKVYKLDFPKEELPAYIEKKLIGKKVDSLKIFLKGKILGNSRLARAVAVEDLYQIKPSFSAQLLKLLKRLRNMLFLFFALPYLSKLKGNGTHLYFQGKV